MSSAQSAPEPTVAANAPSTVRVSPWPLGRLAATAWILPWLALLIADVASDPGCTQECIPALGAPSYWVTGLPLTGLIVPLVLLVSPRVGVWFAAVVAAGIAVIDPLAGWWLALAGALVIFGLAQAVVARRNRVSAGTIPAADGPSVSAAQLSRLKPPRLLSTWLPTAALVFAVVLAGWHQVRWEQERSYGLFAGPSSRVVVIDGSVDDLQIPPGAQVVVKGDFSSASNGGVKLEVWIITSSEPEGTPPEPSDPSWLLGLALAVAGLGLALRSRFSLSQRQAQALLASGSLTARVVPFGSGAALVVDDQAVATVRPLVPGGFDVGPGVSGSESEAAPRFDEAAAVEVIGSPVGDQVVILKQGEAIALARLTDPWPWARLRHPHRWLSDRGSGVDGDDDLDDLDEPDIPDPTELPVDAPMLPVPPRSTS